MKQNIKYIANVAQWRDKVNGNTYHSVRVTRLKDGKQLKSRAMVYGAGTHAQTTADLMLAAGWVPLEWRVKRDGEVCAFSSLQNMQIIANYPVHYEVREGLKREMYANVA